MKLLRILFLTIVLLMTSVVYAETDDSCSRVAIVNNQEVLIDTSTSQKGEGLRFYLEKDTVARKYLNEYQEGTGINWINAAVGTAGTALILSNIFSNSSNENSRKLVIAGASLLVINFLVARTLQAANEDNLVRAIEEYNQRNAPRIIYPVDDINAFRDPSSVGGFYYEKTWSF